MNTPIVQKMQQPNVLKRTIHSKNILGILCKCYPDNANNHFDLTLLRSVDRYRYCSADIIAIQALVDMYCDVKRVQCVQHNVKTAENGNVMHIYSLSEQNHVLYKYMYDTCHCCTQICNTCYEMRDVHFRVAPLNYWLTCKLSSPSAQKLLDQSQIKIKLHASGL